MGDIITADTKHKITANYPNYQTEIHLVWKPAWSIEKHTERGNVRVEVIGNKAILKGNVQSWAEKEQAERTVWSAAGILEVENK